MVGPYRGIVTDGKSSRKNGWYSTTITTIMVKEGSPIRNPIELSIHRVNTCFYSFDMLKGICTESHNRYRQRVLNQHRSLQHTYIEEWFADHFGHPAYRFIDMYVPTSWTVALIMQVMPELTWWLLISGRRPVPPRSGCVQPCLAGLADKI